MEDLLAKISSYNIFNNLIPGAVFFILINVTELYTFEFKSVVLELSAYYFVGLTLSRIGSIALEPVMRYFGILKFAPYQDFVKASKLDSKLDVLSESNNLYRTLFASLLVFLVIYLAEAAVRYFSVNVIVYRVSIITALVVLFAFSYRKQTSYIRRRIEAILRLESI